MPGRKPGSVSKKEHPAENTAFRYCGKPNDEQKRILSGTLGACRWLHNRMLSDRMAMYEQCGDQERRSPAWYKHLMPYGIRLKGADSSALSNEALYLNRAYENFFAGRAGYPKFRKESDHHDSYTTSMTNGNIKVRFNKGRMFLKPPKIKTEIELYGGRRPAPGGKLKSVTVTHEPNGKYYFSLLYEYPETKPEDHCDTEKAIGLDMSMHEFCVTSEGEFIDHEHPFRKAEARLAREQRRLSHMKRGSANYEKQRRKIARLYSKTKNQRKDFAHKLSRRLVSEYDIIGVENLNMRAMAQSLNFGKSVMDKGWGMFVTFLIYKAKRAGEHLIRVSKWFPSSQLCQSVVRSSKKRRICQ